MPNAPETGYGYIRRGETVGSAQRIAQFVEKPSLERAQQFIASGDHYWNSGMFVFRARRYLDELEKFAPEIALACRESFLGAKADLDFIRVDPERFDSCPSDSIDYAVMEKTADAVVVPLDAGWSDVGSWASLHAASNADSEGNVSRGDVIAEDSEELLPVFREPAGCRRGPQGPRRRRDQGRRAGRAERPGAGREEPGRRLKKLGRSEHSLHREVFRPWGSYDSLENGQRFQVKRLCVKPGAQLSLQLHHHRAEHWVVVSGTARITRGDETFLLEENQSTYIPLGVRHRIENPGRFRCT